MGCRRQERALSTMMYLLALIQISNSPFSLVDECVPSSHPILLQR